MEMLGGKILEGKVFYWIAWCFWLIATFLLKRSSAYRTKAAFCVLLVIILVPYKVIVFGFHVNMAALFLYGLGLIYYSQLLELRSLFYHYISVSIIMLAYASFLLFELYDPVWVLFPRDWMLACVLVFISVLLHPTPVARLFSIIIGSIQGEMLVSIVLNGFGVGDWIGELAYFDLLASTLLILFGLSVIEQSALSIVRNVNQHGKEKQKTT
jgi:hypothetical protein